MGNSDIASYINADVDSPFEVEETSAGAIEVSGGIIRFYWRGDAGTGERVSVVRKQPIVRPGELRANVDRWVTERENAHINLLRAGFDLRKEGRILGRRRLADAFFLFETLALLRATKLRSPEDWSVFMAVLSSAWFVRHNREPWERYTETFCGVYSAEVECTNRDQAAAEQGNAKAQTNLGVRYLNGRGVPQDDAEAVRWFRQAAEQGLAESQFNLGVMYTTGEGVPQDDAEAMRWFRQAAEQGHAKAQYNLGFIYENGEGVPLDYAEAERWYRLAAAQGDARAQHDLGVGYATGEGVPQDDAEAVRWFRLAAEQGHAESQFNLGVMYTTGEGVPQDDAEAVRWFRLAADQGHATAQYNLGFIYENGEGVPLDYAEAERWYRLAAAQGDASAQLNLGVMYATGEGVPQDDAEAVRWFRLAAAQGNATAQGNLRAMSAAGRGVPQDDAEAVPDTTLHGLQLSEGPPEPGFFFSAMAGQLPDGNVTLTPAFDPGSTTYHAEVSQPLLTIRARAAVSGNITATGVTADGEELPAGNQTRVNSNGAFLSVTFSELAVGENRIQIASSAGTAYTIVVTRGSAPDS